MVPLLSPFLPRLVLLRRLPYGSKNLNSTGQTTRTAPVHNFAEPYRESAVQYRRREDLGFAPGARLWRAGGVEA